MTAEETVAEASLPPSDQVETSPSVAIDSHQADRLPAARSGNGDDQLQLPAHDPKGQEGAGDKDEDSTEHFAIAAPSQMRSDSGERVSANQALEAALQEAVRAEADSHGHGGSEVDMETSFVPDTTQLAPESSSNSAEEEVDSPMYSPVVDRTISDVPDAESDNYEPPEATPPVDAPSPIESSPFSPAPPDAAPESELVDDSIQIVDDGAQSDMGQLLPEQNGSVPRPIQVKKTYLISNENLRQADDEIEQTRGES
jgi:hypothetical protein